MNIKTLQNMLASLSFVTNNSELSFESLMDKIYNAHVQKVHADLTGILEKSPQEKIYESLENYLKSIGKKPKEQQLAIQPFPIQK